MRRVLIVLLAIVSQMAYSQVINKEKAQERAKSFVSERAKHFSSSARRVASKNDVVLAEGVSNSQCYTFNIGTDAGFVIVAGDERVPSILGYSDTGHISADEMPENMKAWLQSCSNDIKSIQQLPETGVRTAAVPTHPAVEPLVKCQWGQGLPYNSMCPEINGETCATGCVATAMAQILYTLRPEGCAELAGYTTASRGLPLPALPATTFDWDKMSAKYYDDNDPNAMEVAKLMRYCGQSVGMDYDLYAIGSGAFTTYAASAFAREFGMSKGAHTIYSNDLTSAVWDDKIYAEISKGSPVLIQGADHSFVCDGYDGNGMYHINWGWYGLSDGYYYINELKPELGGIGEQEHRDDYSSSMLAVIGISNDHGGKEDQYVLRGSLFVYDHLHEERNNIDEGFKFDIPIDVWGPYVYDIESEVGVGMFDEGGTCLDVASCGKYIFKYQEHQPVSASVQLGRRVADGIYYLRPVSRMSDDADWIEFNYSYKYENAIVINGNTVTKKKSSIEYSNFEISNVEILGTPIVGRVLKVCADVTNNTSLRTNRAYFSSESLGIKRTTSINCDYGDTQRIYVDFVVKEIGTHDLRLRIDDVEWVGSVDVKQGVHYDLDVQCNIKNAFQDALGDTYLLDNHAIVECVIKNNSDTDYEDDVFFGGGKEGAGESINVPKRVFVKAGESASFEYLYDDIEDDTRYFFDCGPINYNPSQKTVEYIVKSSPKALHPSGLVYDYIIEKVDNKSVPSVGNELAYYIYIKNNGNTKDVRLSLYKDGVFSSFVVVDAQPGETKPLLLESYCNTVGTKSLKLVDYSGNVWFEDEVEVTEKTNFGPFQIKSLVMTQVNKDDYSTSTDYITIKTTIHTSAMTDENVQVVFKKNRVTSYETTPSGGYSISYSTLESEVDLVTIPANGVIELEKTFSNLEEGVLYYVTGSMRNLGLFSNFVKYDPTVTNVEAITDKETQESVVYTIDGMKHNSVGSRPGIYIRDGKKVLVR